MQHDAIGVLGKDGEGSASLFYRTHNADGTFADLDWVAVSDLQNINAGMTSAWTDLNAVYVEMNSNTYAFQ